MAVFEWTTRAKCRHCYYFESRGRGRSAFCRRDKHDTSGYFPACDRFALEKDKEAEAMCNEEEK